MSFAGTPLGQGRRLDHNTFLGKPPSNSNRPTSPHRIPPVSYSFGAPVLGSRSPPKPTSSSSARERNPQVDQNNDESALVRYNRLKQQQQQQKSNSNLDPEKWSVKDTSVNIATALHQAAEQDIPPMNPNTAWASGARPTSNVPRSTSVEYEAQSQTVQRRLAPPPNRLAPPSRNKAVKPLSKNISQRTIPDSEEEPSQSFENGRGKSPIAAMLDVAHRTYEKATYYARQRSPADQENGSYDYSAEERDYQTNISKRNFAAHKRNKMSVDNKAYKPSVESEEEEDYDDADSDDGRKRRRKKKKNDSAGATLSLPVISAEKRRKKRKGKGGAAGEEGSESEEERVDERPPSRPVSRAGSRAGSVPRLFPDSSLDVDQRLTHIPEEQDEEAGYTDLQYPETSNDISHDPSGDHSEASFSQPQDIGGKLGKLVFNLWTIVMSCVSVFFHIIGKVAGMVVDILLIRPVKFVSRINFAQAKPYVTLAMIIVLVGYLSQRSLLDPLTNWTRGGSKINYTPPDIPAADIAELNKRLQSIESALSGLIYETEQSKVRTENGDRSRLELISRLGTLEGLVKKDLNGKVRDMERAIAAGHSQRENEDKRVITEVKREMEALKEVVDVLQQRPPPPSPGSETVVGNDEEARSKLKALEERVGSVEGGVKEAIEIGKNAAKADTNSAWWNKISSGKKMTIKSSDGQDVTSLIGNLVENAVISLSNKDVLSRADFALHSAGARIVPRLTSPTYELRASSKSWQLLGFLGSGNGFAIGRPPVTALHHEVHNGYCWPFAGTQGNLGVNLVQPTVIDAISIDHVAREVATDVRSAPRHMEVWGMIDGKENFEKAQQIATDREQKRQEAVERGEETSGDSGFGVPGWMSRREEGLFVRIAEFAYDVLSEKTVQTFPVFDDVRQSGLDFGTVVLRIRDNWGQAGFTCLYRFRVHGKLLVQPPPLLAEDVEAS